MTQEKRKQPRHLVCVLAKVAQAEGGDTRNALISDLSATGAHLLTRTKLAVGEKITLTLHLGKEGAEVVERGGRVVRAQPRPRELAAFWTVNAAIEFDQPLPEALTRQAVEKA